MSNIWLIVKVFFASSLVVTGFELADIKLLEAVGTDISPVLPFIMAGITFSYCDFNTSTEEKRKKVIDEPIIPIIPIVPDTEPVSDFGEIRTTETLPEKEKEYQRNNGEKAVSEDISPAEVLVEPPTDVPPVGLPIEPPAETPVEFPTVPNTDSYPPVEPPTDTPSSMPEKVSSVHHSVPAPPETPVQGDDPLDEPESGPAAHISNEDSCVAPPDDIPTDVMPV